MDELDGFQTDYLLFDDILLPFFKQLSFPHDSRCIQSDWDVGLLRKHTDSIKGHLTWDLHVQYNYSSCCISTKLNRVVK